MSRNPTHRPAAWFQIAVGIAVIGWWAVAAATHGIPELEEGRIDIVFHVAAELVMAWLLISAGFSGLGRGTTPASTMLSGLALGALAYSSINSPGYFAERGEWWAVSMFAAVGATAAVTALRLTHGSTAPETEQRSGGSRVFGVRSDTMSRRLNTPDRDRHIANAP